jgi:hypothetical protein
VAHLFFGKYGRIPALLDGSDRMIDTLLVHWFVQIRKIAVDFLLQNAMEQDVLPRLVSLRGGGYCGSHGNGRLHAGEI